MNIKAVRHFKKADPKLYSAYKQLEGDNDLEPSVSKDLFKSLCRIIVGQQLSGKAAHAIWTRFEDLFPKKKVSAENVLNLKQQEIRDAGMAWAKVRALHDLAEKVLSQKVRLKKLKKMNSEEVFEELIQVKGVGPWSIEMFLMFSLGYEDFFSYGDLGLMKGIQKIYKLKNKPTEIELNRLTKKWSPYRTYAACILWRHVDGDYR